MTQVQFEALVNRLENYSQKNPKSYKFRVGLLAILGYAYIVGIVAVLLAIVALLILLVIYSRRINAGIVKLFILLLVPIFITARSLWESFTLRFPPPSGIDLDRRQVPQLFSLVDESSAALKCPSFDRILLTSEFNAGVVQIPKGFLLGGQENYLLIGLPLLQSVSPEQFKAILAHEFGHLSGNHGRFNGWIYRMRQTWMQILERLQQSQQGGAIFLFQRFFNWYAPFFNAYSFVLARTDEYEADRCAAELAGTHPTAAALVNVNVKGFFLEELFWNDVYQQADRQPDPPQELFVRMGNVLKGELEPERARQWLQKSLDRKTDLADTHPCLRDRVAALKISPEELPDLLSPPAETAANYFLAGALTPLAEQLSQDWQTGVTYQWRERYAQTQELRQQLQDLDRKADGGVLTEEEAWQQAKLTTQLEGYSASIPLLQSILENNPSHVSANYWLGQILLSQGDERGIEHLETSMASDRETILDGCQHIYRFLQQQGRETEALPYQKRAEEYYQNLLLAKQEREKVSDRDRFAPHELPSERVSEFARQLAGYSEVKAAYLVKKAVQYLPEKPFYVLGIERDRSPALSDDRALLDRLANELNCPGETWIIIFNDRNKALAKALQKIDSQPIFQK